MKITRIIFVLVFSGLFGYLYGINPRDINDTTNIRISSAELRAELLTNLMKKKLDLSNEEFTLLKTINLKAEERLQQLVIDNPAKAFTGRSKGPDKFDQFAAQRTDAYKQALGKKFSVFMREQYVLRNELKKAILAHNENISRQEAAQKKADAQAEEERKAADLAARQKAYQEQKAQATQKNQEPTKDKSTKKTKKKKGKKKKKK
jgi:hypothetical protein